MKPNSDASSVPTECQIPPHVCLAQAEAIEVKQPQQAEHMLDQCLHCPETIPDQFRLLAALQEERGALARSRQTLALGLQSFPDNAMLWLATGRLALSLGRPAEGLSALSKAARLRPDDENLHRELLYAKMRFGDAPARVSASIEPLLAEAEARLDRGDIQGAIHTLEDALHESSSAPSIGRELHHRIAVLHLANQQWPQAKTHAETGIQLQNKKDQLQASLWLVKAESHLGLEELDDAIAASQKSTALQTNNALAWANLAVAYARKGEMEPCLKAFEAAVKYDLATNLTKKQVTDLFSPTPDVMNQPDFQKQLRAAWPEP